MLKELYQKRGLFPVWIESEKNWNKRREEVIQIICNEEYGFLPRMHDEITWEVESENKRFCAGKVTLQKVILTTRFGKEKFSFPISVMIPNEAKKHPFFIHISLREQVPNEHMPVEEICDRGFAVISFDYQVVTADDHKLPDGGKGYVDRLKNILFSGIEKKDNHCGKIAIWAWAASRAMDYAQTLENLDLKSAAIIGHSRLGKTALFAAALDERFTCAISNNSGNSGAAISRMKKGENIRCMTSRFGYWFCDNYRKYAGKENELPFDQHFLLAAIAPRRVYVASAAEDSWSDPESEFFACYAASEVYEKLGLKGFVCPDRFPEIGEYFQEGNIGYHIRKGTHYLSREDWNLYMDYLKKHIE